MNDTLPAFFSSGSKRILLLLEIDATELEARDCMEIYKFVRQTGKANIKFETLGSLSFGSGNIPVNKIPFIRNMLRHRYCTLSNAQVEFSHRIVDPEGLSDFVIQLENRYKEIERIAGTDTIHFPTNMFTSFAPGIAREIDLKSENLADINTGEAKEKLMSIDFGREDVPGIICPTRLSGQLRSVAEQNLVFRLSEYAKDDADFYTHTILPYKRQFTGNDRELLEKSLGRLNPKSDQELRRLNTELILKQILESFHFGRPLLQQLMHESDGVFTRFNVENIHDLDFFQSLFILHSFFHSHRKSTGPELHKLIRYIKDSPVYYLTENELVGCILLEVPNLSDMDQRGVYDRFVSESIPARKTGAQPLVLRVTLKQGGLAEPVFIHRENLGMLIDYEVAKVKKTLSSRVIEEWKEKISRMALVPEMVVSSRFRKLLARHLEAHNNLIYQILREDGEIQDPSVYDILNDLEEKNRTVRLCIEHGWEEIEYIFGLEKEFLYDKAISRVLDDLNPFLRFFFIIVHWFKRRSLISGNIELIEKERKEEQKYPEEEPEKEPAGELRIEEAKKPALLYRDSLFGFAGINNHQELHERISTLRNKIPGEGIPEDVLRQSIRSDLRKLKKIVFAGIMEVYDINLNRWAGESDTLRLDSALKQYILLQVFHVIAESHMELEEDKAKAMARIVPVIRAIFSE